jgi:hypothetical protein
MHENKWPPWAGIAPHVSTQPALGSTHHTRPILSIKEPVNLARRIRGRVRAEEAGMVAGVF